MSKKIISVFLCVTLLLTAIAFCVPANAATADLAAGYNQKTTLKNADDFSWDNASVYFLLTDRFYNGNTSNDHSYGRTLDKNGNPISGWNTAPATFHGGDFAGITQKINEGYFDNLGVNAIWISAPYEQIHGGIDSGQDFVHYSYHGYYVLDYTETDANFGTKEEFRTLVDTAHQHGIRVVMDIVMNHSGYNSVADMEEYNFGTLLAGASDFKYKLTGYSDVNNHIDFKSSASDWGRWWGSDWIRSGLPGYTEGDGSELQQSLMGLPDFKTEQTKSVTIPPLLQTKWTKEGTYNQKVSKYGTSDTVTGYISKWLAEWVSEYGVDGFRCDTAKHVEYASWNQLKTACVSALKEWRQNNPGKAGADWTDDFWMTGEHWDYKLGYGDYYTKGGFDSMINFSFSGSGVPAAGSINGVYQNYAETINNQAGFNALTYISSHDSNLARGDLIYQGSAFQLLPGAIQIFYGDETNRSTVPGMGFDGHGGSGHSLRSDMNWSTIDQTVLQHWQKVGQFRARHVAVGAGDHQQITAYNASTGYTFSRSYDNGEMTDGIIAVIAAPKNTQIDVNVSSMWGNGTTVTNFYDGTTAVVQNGKATFNSGANGTILIEGPQSTIHMSVKGAYAFYDSETVTVSLRGADYAMVSVNGGQPFRVIDGDTFAIGDGVALGEVFTVSMTATNSEETLQKSFNFKKKDPNAITSLYFDNSRYRWSVVNAYIYDESSGAVSENEKWPGQAMTVDSATGLYVIEVPDGLENGRVIFNAGSGSSNRYPADQQPGLEINETNMLFSYGNSWTPYNGEKADPTTPVDPKTQVTVYFDNSGNGFSTPYIYYWRSSTNSGDVAWPGVAMSKYEGNLYQATFSSENDMCIFSDAGNAQSGDLGIPGNGFLFNGSAWSEYKTEEPTTQPETVKPTTQPVTQPATQSETKPDTSTDKNVLIGDVNRDGVITIVDATAIQLYLARSINLADEAYAAADTDQDGKVNIRDATVVQYYVAQFFEKSPHVGTYLHFAEDKTEPTTASPATQPATVAPATQPETTVPVTEPAEKNYLYIRTNDWTNVKAYYWSDDNKEMTQWPGVDTESLGSGVYRIELPDGATYIIFNNNGGNGANQTADLRIEGYNKIYENGSWQPYG